MADTFSENETELDNTIWLRIQALCMDQGLDVGQLAKSAGVSRTTLHHWQQGKTCKPRNSTLFKLAETLHVKPSQLTGEEPLSPVSSPNPRPLPPAAAGVSPAGDFPLSTSFPAFPALKASSQAAVSEQRELTQAFDRETNWTIQNVCEQKPELFQDWSEQEWDELFSSFGTGGELNEQGVVLQAEAINQRRETIYQLNVILETHLADAARKIIASLYESVQCLPAAGKST